MPDAYPVIQASLFCALPVRPPELLYASRASQLVELLILACVSLVGPFFFASLWPAAADEYSPYLVGSSHAFVSTLQPLPHGALFEKPRLFHVQPLESQSLLYALPGASSPLLFVLP